MKPHRAVTLVVMMVIALGTLALLLARSVDHIDGHSLLALGFVVVAAAAAGIGFSWKRYSRR
jgi:energy-converting hydrogenase Eha subunit C